MQINLKQYAKQAQKESIVLHIKERLPYFILTPCDVRCVFQVIEQHDYHLISMQVETTLNIICQRCLEPFVYTYHNHTELAVCRNEEDAAHYMNAYDCIVSQSSEVDLLEIVTDDLHLCGHEKHEDLAQCQQVSSSQANH